jgi:hypothetical protein
MAQMSFDHNAFGDAMYADSMITLDDYDPNHHGWETNNGQTMAYAVEGYSYETWWHDVTRCRDDWAIMVSSKTDHKRSSKDDHMVVIAVFNRDHHLVAAQASVQTIQYNDSGNTGVIWAKLADGQVPDANTDVQVANDVSNALVTVIEGILGDNDDDGFFDLRLVAYHTLMCMVQAVRYQ